MAVYASPLAGVADKDIPRRLGERLGLARLQANPLADEDGITSLEVAPEKSGRGYIPYSNRRLLWHTDGYYNPPGKPHPRLPPALRAPRRGGRREPRCSIRRSPTSCCATPTRATSRRSRRRTP